MGAPNKHNRHPNRRRAWVNNKKILGQRKSNRGLQEKAVDCREEATNIALAGNNKAAPRGGKENEGMPSGLG